MWGDRERSGGGVIANVPASVSPSIYTPCDANTNAFPAQLSTYSHLDAEDLQKMKFYATTNFHIWLIRAACYFCCVRVGLERIWQFQNRLSRRSGVAGVGVIENWLRTSNICSSVYIIYQTERQSYPTRSIASFGIAV